MAFEGGHRETQRGGGFGSSVGSGDVHDTSGGAASVSVTNCTFVATLPLLWY